MVVSNLVGSGTIQARGGNSTGWDGGGGGGRVAVYARDWSGFNTNNIMAAGGTALNPGGAGTVYLRDLGQPVGTVIIDAGSGGAGWTPLGVAGTNWYAFTEPVVIRGAGSHVQPEHTGLVLDFGSTLTVISGATLQVGSLNFDGSFGLQLGTNCLLSVSGSITSTVPVAIGAGTVVVNGITAPALSVTGGALLACAASSASQMHWLDLEVSGTIQVDASSRIDVSGLGYVAGYTTGNTTLGGATSDAGGSYGGIGGNSYSGGNYGSPNAVYGDYAAVEDWGSGGGTWHGGSSGGGRVRVVAGTLQLDGKLWASGPDAAGAGSGGGVLLVVSNLVGSGTIQARGGNGGYGGGGGGRIAVYARDWSGFDTNNITAVGGTGSSPGGAGTVYLRDLDEPTGTVIIDAGNGGAGWTPLGVAGTNWYRLSERVVIRGSRSHVAPEHGGLVLDFGSTLTVINGATLQVGSLNFDGSFGLQLGTNCLLSVSGSITSTVPVAIGAGTVVADGITAPALSVTGGALLACAASSASQMHWLDLEVSGTIQVDASSRIDVSGLGYVAGYTTGNTTVGGATSDAGGSYGGIGGSSYSGGNYGSPNAVYGDYAAVEDWGSGGGTWHGGSSGGGRMRVVAGTLQLDGKLWASGPDAAGAGSGGGVLLVVSNLVGSGTIQARGGNGGYGGGGGGRIAVYARDWSGFDTNNITAAGGTGSSPGGAGTVYLRDLDEPTGTVIINGGSGGAGWTPLGVAGTNWYRLSERVVIRGSRSHVAPEHGGLVLDFGSTLTVINGATLQVGSLNFDGSFGLQLGTNCLLSVSGSITSTVPVAIGAGTVVVDGITAPALSVTGGALLACAASSASQMHWLDLEVSGTIQVDASSRIDVSGLGYVAGYTTGNTTVGGATSDAGGSYGGIGGSSYSGGNYGSPNAVYGDYAAVEDWGSGGGTWHGGSSGGGRMRVVAGTLQLDGKLWASGPDAAGAGSGGGVLLVVSNLVGSGTIQARGGNGGYGGGGGGRIAVYARDWSGFDTNNITAVGGTGSSPGGAGTVYLRDLDEPTGTVIIDGGSGGAGWTPLGVAGTNWYRLSERVVIQGSRAHVAPEHGGLVLDFENMLVVTNGATLQVGSLTCGSAFALQLGSNSLISASGSITSTIPVAIPAATVMVDGITAPALSVTSGALLTCLPSTAAQIHKLEVNVAGTVMVSSDSRIDVSGTGYGPGYGSGNTTVGGATGLSGGSYGGRGNSSGGSTCVVYGDYAAPEEPGSGSGPGNGNTSGAAGGGLVRITAGTLWLDGQLLADGGSATGGGNNGCGGSGGGIYVAVGTLQGSGLMRAQGGSGGLNPIGGLGGAGGGGRIAVYALGLGGFETNKISAPGGAGPSGGAYAAASGTVWLVRGFAHTHGQFTEPGVMQVFPTNNYTLFMNTPFTNGLAIQFNNPVSSNSLSPSQLSIQGPFGIILPTAASLVGDRLYQFAFPPQTENGYYHFTLLPTLLDTEGFQLDQNANGVTGEPADVYDLTLVLDTVPPRVTASSPGGDVAGTVPSVDVWFSEEMSPALLIPGNVTLRSPSSNTIPISAVQHVGLNRWRISFPAQTAIGIYQLQLFPEHDRPGGKPAGRAELGHVPIQPRARGLAAVGRGCQHQSSVGWRHLYRSLHWPQRLGRSAARRLDRRSLSLHQ